MNSKTNIFFTKLVVAIIGLAAFITCHGMQEEISQKRTCTDHAAQDFSSSFFTPEDQMQECPLNMLPPEMLCYISSIAVEGGLDTQTLMNIALTSKAFKDSVQITKCRGILRITDQLISARKISQLHAYLAAHAWLIRVVDAISTRINDETLATICAFNPYIQIFGLSGCSDLTQFNLMGLQNITKLYLSDTKITDTQLTTICSNAPDITTLDLSGCTQLSQFNLKTLTHLKNLYLSGTNITDEQLTAICAKNPELEVIDLTACRELEQFNLRNLHNLKELHLRNTKITDGPLTKICENNRLISESHRLKSTVLLSY